MVTRGMVVVYSKHNAPHQRPYAALDVRGRPRDA
jgi:hypothetical protein